ncbi:phospholipase D family protein [Fimbriiglobus ruber]|uniref:phospholipase D n=1 Tax=Fimbriiglobus ruber TaxID=1908690 RepID=A0A225DJE4_9BACT|nr:phospholipase D family protein [Fimbriiglobus ruber]OWK36257.1 Endonuclease [Fimbriiglobus ruber]
MPEWYIAGAGAGVGFGVTILIAYAFEWLKRQFVTPPTVTAHYSPKGGCKDAVITEISHARREILVQAYSFSCKEIAQALVTAAGRGVTVRVLLDKSNEKETYSEIGDLEQHKIDLLIDASHAIAHNKIMIIDAATILTGSFNFTRQAELENAENLLVIKGHGALVDQYRQNFHAHRDHCLKPGTAANRPAAPGRVVQLQAA